MLQGSSKTSFQTFLNLLILVLAILSLNYLTPNATNFSDYNNQIIEIVRQISLTQDQPDLLHVNENIDSKIDDIVKKVPQQLISKNIENTFGIETVLKLFSLGYRGRINHEALKNRGRGVMRFNEVIEVLMSIGPSDKLLANLLDSYVTTKYGKSEENQQQKQNSFYLIIWTHIIESQTLGELENLERSLDSISLQEYQIANIEIKVVNIGEKSRVLELGKQKIIQKYSKFHIQFIDNEPSHNKAKTVINLLKYQKPMQEDAIILMMDSSDELITPYALKIINKFYQDDTILVFTQEILKHDLSVKSVNLNFTKISQQWKHNQNKSSSSIRKIDLPISINFKNKLIKELENIPKEKLMIDIPVKNKNKETQRISIFQMESPIIDRHGFDGSFMYPMIQMAVQHCKFAPEIVYKVSTIKKSEQRAHSTLEIQHQANVIQNIRGSKGLEAIPVNN